MELRRGERLRAGAGAVGAGLTPRPCRETARGSNGSSTRGELIGRLAEAISSATIAHPLRVAIDGPPAAGKTTLADELAVVLRAQDRDVIRATVDDFLFPRAQRYRRGRYSAEGCYLDAHDHADVIVYNDQFQRPTWEIRPHPSAYGA
ncbi:hypothetical protein DFQ13_103707 [Actinokineospora spheciospongiae]|nr:hypothetical protein DFQ13_103707 [Actinokineospora spheciospongiae]